jgi:hypothetical protein
MSARLWVPKAVFGATTLVFTQPIDAWRARGESVGNGDEAASGVGAAIEIRYDNVIDLTLRFLESEYDAVAVYVRWMQKNRSLTHSFWFDQSDALTTRVVRYHGPHLPTPFDPSRRDAYLPLYEFAIRLRTADGTAFGLNWSGV